MVVVVFLVLPFVFVRTGGRPDGKARVPVAGSLKSFLFSVILGGGLRILALFHVVSSFETNEPVRSKGQRADEHAT